MVGGEQGQSGSAAGQDDAMLPGLYLHIPFCLSKCAYCDFYSVTATEKIPFFIASLIREMELYRGVFERFDTLYLGGGTPSLLGRRQTGEILDALDRAFLFSDDTEITIEANPRDLCLETASSLRAMQINRINIGVQSFDAGTLALLGRRHRVIEAISAIKSARRAGFGNVGLDLIYGVPGQDLRSWRKTLGRALSFTPEHLSCYQLTLEPSTPLGLKYRSGEVVPPEDDLLYELFMCTSETLEKAGYVHYEVSNFARGDKWMSRHNRKYWDHTPYLGLGPAAHSFFGNRRWWNHRCLDRYIEATNRNVPPIEGSEILTSEQLHLESLYLGLRTKRGIALKDFSEGYHCDKSHRKDSVLKKLLEEGLITITNNRLHPTRRGLALSDSLSLL